MKIQLVHSYQDIISLENLLSAWQEFIIGKKSKPDVQQFSRNLMDNIIALHEDLKSKTYQHGGYESFFVNDPKRRHIHKASVRDRLLHHAVYRILYPFFDKTFIANSFSCRNDKGTHKALNYFRAAAYQVSRNHTRTCWVLKCDIRQFFASIDHKVLLSILTEYVPEKDILDLLKNIIVSFRTNPDQAIGLPLGNLTSQLFANVYMNQFDQWVKHTVKEKYYIRYADDFVFLSSNKLWLENLLPKFTSFLLTKLHLTLHPHKIVLKTLASGVDYLGWLHFPNHRVLRRATKRRMFARTRQNPAMETAQSYLGLLQHGNAYKVSEQLKMRYWLYQ